METLTLGSTGPNVKLIQSLLARIGYNIGSIDGVFGSQTRNAVMQFQRNNGLTPDGVVGPATWNIFERFLIGYDTYTIRPGDTLYNLARRFYTRINSILTANPGINPNTLRIGQRIIIPYGIPVVFTDIDYTYEIMDRDIKGLTARYPFIEVGTIGKSIMGKNLYYIKLGSGTNQVSYNASHHANEWITTPVLMNFIERFADAYARGSSIKGYNVRDIWNYSSIYLIPMLNPDGVDLVLYWPNYDSPEYQQATRLNKTGLPLPRVWKANINGIDLNLNYPAEWEKEHQMEIEAGIIGPAPRDYGGPYALSEPESRAMVNFTKQHNFRLVLAFHTQGEVIYWQFDNYAPPIAKRIADLFGRISGYIVSYNPGEAAYAGYKDWFLQEYRKPGYTIEVGKGSNPIPISQFSTIYRQVEEILLLGALV